MAGSLLVWVDGLVVSKDEDGTKNYKIIVMSSVETVGTDEHKIDGYVLFMDTSAGLVLELGYMVGLVLIVDDGDTNIQHDNGCKYIIDEVINTTTADFIA